ncbi:hypothetical protein A5869_000919 [Enterococcus cecorum]|uniref:Uncharacterized protein n=2 Tax=Enterococcus cecorum TaxID=44008 RepID=A0A200I4I1_9ENTE|nr:hypothetical protein A5869_000919 [Enterococcus cecorum]
MGSSACHIAVSQIQKRNELDVELFISEDTDLFHSLFEQRVLFDVFILWDTRDKKM